MRRFPAHRIFLAPISLLACSLPGAAQSFIDASANVPAGAPFNASSSENVDLADCDLDGDLDAAFADGGESGNDQNRLWINQGGAQGGSLAHFVDESSTRLPSVLDTSRDIEFVDFDADADPDIFVANSSSLSNQTSRFWVNSGGFQNGTPGFFVDESSARWSDVGLNDGQTLWSSISPTLVLSGGGFVDWAGDAGFADLDGDGDLDVMQATYGITHNGKGPTRLFLNDGSGVFTEYNPAGYQLTGTNIPDGAPALWCEGVQDDATSDASGAFADVTALAMSMDLGDLDGDFDIDLVLGNVLGDVGSDTRFFQNPTAENGDTFLRFRDITHGWMPPGFQSGGRAYEQEFGDLDQDGDLDMYGGNWGANLEDLVYLAQGDGSFAPQVVVPGSAASIANEPELIDFDADGDLDVVTAADSGQEQLMENQGAAGGYAFVIDNAQLPVDSTSSLGLDAGDLDGDGDFDLFVANDQGDANVLLLNVTETPDTFAPKISALLDAPDRQAGPAPTIVRAHVLDNESWTLVAMQEVTLEVSLDGSEFQFLFPMRWSGGQVFQGEIPGQLAGIVRYRVRATDLQQNVGLSPSEMYVASTSCAPGVAVYCSSQPSSGGCLPSIFAEGHPSASAGAGLMLRASQLESQGVGLFVYSKTGAATISFGGGTLCVAPPVTRTPGQLTGGAGACAGGLAFDLNAYAASGPDQGLVAGASLWLQAWSRDAGAASGSNLSDGLQLTLCP